MSSEAIASSGAVSTQAIQAQDKVQLEQSPAMHKVEEARAVEKVQKAQDASELNSEPTVEDLEAAVGQINNLMKEGQRALAFNLDRDSGQVVVKVTNNQTGELIRQIPNEDALKFAKNIESMMGLIFNDKA